jgi:peptide/nickel transport system ATP-binding protein
MKAAIFGDNLAEPMLQVQGLKVYYDTPKGDVIAVDGISLDLFSNDTLGIVGESGCGKSTAAMGILNLVNEPGRIVGGEVVLQGVDILSLKDEELRQRRWTEIALIPQGAMNSLNPTMTVRQQIKDVVFTHENSINKEQFNERLSDLIKMVGLPTRVLNLYPHELSGGMKQRVCIAMAVALKPKVLIADEATSALDVIVQRVIAQTLKKVSHELGLAMIMIGHDMGLMAQMTTKMAVMYAGNIVEIAPTNQIFEMPLHPYTKLLLSAVPSLTERKPLHKMDGITHDPRNPPSGCIFRLRCPIATTICAEQRPFLQKINSEKRGQVACHHHDAVVDMKV